MKSLFKKMLVIMLFVAIVGVASSAPIFATVPEAQATPTMPVGSGHLNFVHNLKGSEADMNTPWPYSITGSAQWHFTINYRVYLVDSVTREIITFPGFITGMHEEDIPTGMGWNGEYTFIDCVDGSYYRVTSGWWGPMALYTTVYFGLLPGQEVVVIPDNVGNSLILSVDIVSNASVPGFSERSVGYTLTHFQYSEGGHTWPNVTGVGLLTLPAMWFADPILPGIYPYFVQASATWTRGEVTNIPMASTLTKNLAMPEGVVVLEDLEFAFNFEPVLSASPNPPTQTAPSLVPSPIIVTVEAGTTSAELNLIPIFENMIATNPHLHAGSLDWIVTEIDTGQVGVTYDTTSRFRLRLHLANQDPPNTGLRISAIEVFSIAPGPNPVETKLGDDGLAFTNAFAPDTGTVTDPALSISKTIAGDRHYANLITDFTFTLTLTPPTFSPPLAPPHQDISVSFTSPLTGTIMPGNTAVPFSINAATGIATATFNLRDGQHLQIPTLPAGTTFSVLETGMPAFAPSVIVTEAGIAGSVQTPPPISGTTIGQDLNVAGIVSNAINIITIEGIDVEVSGNAADFTNAYHRLPITGLIITNLPFAVALFSALAASAVLLSMRNRRRIEGMSVG